MTLLDDRPDTRGPGDRPPLPTPTPRARRVERTVGVLALVGTALTVWLGLWVTPPDASQGNTVPGNLVRLVYLHPGVAWVALYLAFGLAALASLLYLWPRTRAPFWDRLAAASVEVGVVFNVCTLISGSIWGKPTWGVWWAWDARLTSTAVLLVLFLGYLAIRRLPAEPEVRARRSAFVALFAAVDIPIVHFSVLWWNTLHQGATVLNSDLSPTIHGSQAWTLLLGFVSLTLVFVWMLLVRYRIGVLEDWLDGNELDAALAERRAEGPAPTPAAGALGSIRNHRYDQGGGRMSYVIAGYSIVLAILFLYAVLLVVRRRRLTAAAVRVAATGVASSDGVPVGPTAATGSTPGGGAGAGGDGR